MKPTRTTNPLHFEDLSPGRFEDLALGIAYRLKQWEDIHHDGRKGGDAGVDILGIEKASDGSLRRWFFQCKRYLRITAAEIKKAVDEAVKKSPEPPDVLVLILGCDVSLKVRTAFEDRAAHHGIQTAIVWTASKLETILRADHPELLFTFFGISMARRERSREADLRRTLALKRKLQRLLPSGEYHPDIIVRSIDDTSYPEIEDPGEGRISSWFKVEFGGHDPNGLNVIWRIEQLIVDKETGEWAEVDHSDADVKDVNDLIDLERYETLNAYTVGRIPFRNIFEAEDENDAYNPGVHLYCRFADAGMPYAEIFRREIKGLRREFRRVKQFKFADRKRSPIGKGAAS